MAKRSTPKKQQANSQSSRRFKAFQNRARKRLANTAKLSICPQCKEPKLSHAVCPGCGHYKGRKALDMDKQIDKITKVKA
ncbi:50S ribosomal protein L32 [Candidatus Peregrinibacteria bacterium]|nr:50S ribosomal protein L32 [Candidatus Peregrinibacteria bacterium]